MAAVSKGLGWWESITTENAFLQQPGSVEVDVTFFFARASTEKNDEIVLNTENGRLYAVNKLGALRGGGNRRFIHLEITPPFKVRKTGIYLKATIQSDV